MTSSHATTATDAFRDEVRGFFDEVLPGVLDGVEGTVNRAKAWRAALFDRGLGALDYPADVGGRAADPELMQVWRQESRGRIPREDSVFGIGVGMAMPTVRDHGSEELRRRFIAPGLRGDEIWCQMYSEPGSGSDLASLTTRADLDGDEWVVTGQKVWTSGAHHADFAILLARTDWTAPKHRGITMFVLAMDQPGVEVRPLVQMTGVSEFNEVFLTEARVPRDWVVGEVNGGWSTAVALLGHERQQTGTKSMSGTADSRSKAGRSPIPMAQLRELAERAGRTDDPMIRQELARLHSGEQIVKWIGARGLHPSIGKLWRTKQGRAAAEVAAALAFPGSPAWRSEALSQRDIDDDYFAYHVLNCRGMSLGGGTDEIQKNTLGERALGLPREPGPDRNTPFDELARN
ncbi:MAG: acyl-CoA dehydrogenase family protein [Actinomycetota bacterium]